MNLTVYILLWLLPSIILSMIMGASIGYGMALRRHGKQIDQERKKTLAALQGVRDAADELSTEVGTHQQELETVRHDLDDLSTDGVYEQVKSQLLGQIENLVRSNRRVQQDLACTRYQMQVQAQELDRTRQEARRDELSGVANRKAFDEMLRYLLTLQARRDAPFALILIDVDHFKWINDTHGHLCGDQVISRLGSALSSEVRPSDLVARYGGDEFAVLLRDLGSDGSWHVALRIREQIDATNFDVGPDGACLAVTLSMGLVNAEADDTDESLLRKADEALYASKRAGRNRLTAWTPDCTPTSDVESPALTRG